MQEKHRSIRHWFIAMSLVAASAISGCNQGLPQIAHEQIFEKSRFSDLIQMNLPNEDSRDFLKSVCTTEFGMKPLHLNSATQHGNPHLVSYLMQNNYAEIQDAVIHSRYGNEDIKFFFYTSKFHENPNMVDNGGRSDIGGSRHTWNLGRRALKNITYTNRYKAAPMGVPLEIIGITFNYGIEWTAPEFSDAGGSYEGKAQVYLDPNDGQWKIEQLNLSDNGSDEFLQLLKARYPAYDRDAPSGMDGCAQYADIIEAQRAHEERKRVAGIPTTVVGTYSFEQSYSISKSKMLPVELTITDASIVTSEAFAIFFPDQRTKNEYFFSQIQRPYDVAGTQNGYVFVGKKFDTVAQSDHQQMIADANNAFEAWKARNAQLIAECPDSKTWGCVD